MPTVAPPLLAAIPAAVPAVVVALLAAFVVPIWLALLIGLVVGALIVLTILARAPEMALRALGAQPIAEGDEPRLESLVESVCASHGIEEPDLFLVESRAPDAAVVGRSDDTHLVLTTGALRQLDRLELEAVVARELAQFGTGIQSGTVLVPVSMMLGPFAAALRERMLDTGRMATADIDGVRLTRYPPALASALQKAADGGGVPDRAASNHLWLIGPAGGTGPLQTPLIERIDTLREL